MHATDQTFQILLSQLLEKLKTVVLNVAVNNMFGNKKIKMAQNVVPQLVGRVGIKC